MELVQSIFMILVIIRELTNVNSSVSILLAIIVTVLIIISLFIMYVKVICVTKNFHISKLDIWLSKNGYCTIRGLGAGHLPSDGIHFAWKRGPIVVFRSTIRGPHGDKISTSYVITVNSSYHSLIPEIEGDQHLILCTLVQQPATYRTEYVYCRVNPMDPIGWQKKVSSVIYEKYVHSVEHYESEGWKGVTILICGEKNTGKSSIGIIVASLIKKKFPDRDPNCFTVNISNPGLCISEMVDMGTELNPTILMLNEIDVSFDKANSGSQSKSPKEGNSMMDDKTTCTNVLDTLVNLPHVIIIATTNKTMEEMTGNDSKYSVYTRIGRFDYHVTSESLQENNGSVILEMKSFYI